MAVKHVVTLGFGFADGTGFIPTLGFSAGEASADSAFVGFVVRSAVGSFVPRSEVGSQVSRSEVGSFVPRSEVR